MIFPQVFKDYWKKFERLREQPTTLQRKHSILLKNEIKELQGFVGIKEIGSYRFFQGYYEASLYNILGSSDNGNTSKLNVQLIYFNTSFD